MGASSNEMALIVNVGYSHFTISAVILLWIQLNRLISLLYDLDTFLDTLNEGRHSFICNFNVFRIVNMFDSPISSKEKSSRSPPDAEDLLV